jgi:hypothetical protein
MKRLVAVALVFGLLSVSPTLVPAADPTDYESFVSLWEGALIVGRRTHTTQFGMLPVSVLVKTIDTDKKKASVTYSQGNSGPFTAYSVDAEGKFLNEKTLETRFLSNSNVSVTLTLTISQNKKELGAKYTAPGRWYMGTLMKVETK